VSARTGGGGGGSIFRDFMRTSLWMASNGNSLVTEIGISDCLEMIVETTIISDHMIAFLFYKVGIAIT